MVGTAVTGCPTSAQMGVLSEIAIDAFGSNVRVARTHLTSGLPRIAAVRTRRSICQFGLEPDLRGAFNRRQQCGQTCRWRKISDVRFDRDCCRWGYVNKVP